MSNGIAEERALTDLPLPIIHRIFSFLETIDALRATAVSRHWRYFWTSTPYFHFNINTIWPDPSSKFGCFKDFVNWVLLCHDTSIFVLKFDLCCPFLKGDNSVYRWIKWLINKRVREFELTLLQFENLGLDAPLLELPISFVKLESLEVLRLNLNERILDFHHCVGVGFAGLKCLELKNVKLMNENITRDFVKACPLLEDFSMVQCFFQGFDISGRNMKRLTLQDCHFPGEGRSVLKVDCPSLAYFNFIGYVADSFCLKDLPCLEEAFCLMKPDEGDRTDEEYGYVLCDMLKGLLSAKVLKLSCFVVMYLSDLPISELSSLSFSNLKSLKFGMGMHECQLRSTINLLKACPRLEALAIVFDEYEQDDWSSWQMPDEEIIFHLKIIEFSNFNGNKKESELIKFVLRNGRALGEVNIIWWQRDELDGSKTIQKQRKKRIAEEILRLQRSSSNVAFTFVQPKRRVDIFSL